MCAVEKVVCGYVKTRFAEGTCMMWSGVVCFVDFADMV